MSKKLDYIKNWVANKTATVSIALANVEKNAFGQTGELLSSDVNHAQKHTQGQVADSLINGEITQEVMDLRWRMYKVLQESEGLSSEIIDYEPDGTPITKTKKRDNKKALKKIKLDDYDKEPLEMVVNNDEIISSGNDVMNNDYIQLLDEVVINYDDKGEIISATHGSISGEEYFASNKTDKPITVNSEGSRKFNLETFTKKLNIRTKTNGEKILEFCVSKYPDEYNRTSRLFLSELKKAIEKPEKSSILEINEVEFVTYKTTGVNDFLAYKYKINSFHKIIEFNGYYVIKFIGEVITNGEDILLKHKQSELEEKYKNKEKK